MYFVNIVETILLHQAEIGISDGTDIHGYTGKEVDITCSHSWASTNIKYFCRDPCGHRDILVKSDQTPKGRYIVFNGEAIKCVTRQIFRNNN